MQDFKFENINVKTVIAHTILPKKANENTQPILSDHIITLEDGVAALFELRLSDALGSKSHGVQMDIERNNPGDPVHICAEIFAKEDGFVERSQEIAKKLQLAHTNASWPGGVMFLVCGTIGANNKKFIAIIKAETDKGLTLIKDAGTAKLKLIKDMLLSQQQKLYKVAMIVQNAPLVTDANGIYQTSCFLCFLFDHTLTLLETGRPAAYFYNSFMGMTIRKSDTKYTQIFFEQTQQFINNNSQLTDEEKADCRELLRATLKDNTPSIKLDDFADNAFNGKVKDAYIEHMNAQDFPNRAIVKNNDYIKKKLRRPRKTTMTSGVQILVPGDKNPKDLIEKKEVKENKTTFIIDGVIESEDIS